MQQHHADRGDRSGQARTQQDVRWLPAPSEQGAAETRAKNAAEPADAERPTDPGRADAGWVFRRRQTVGAQLPAHDAHAHYENRRQKDEIRQATQRDRRDDDNAACQADSEHTIGAEPAGNGPSSSTLRLPPAL